MRDWTTACINCFAERGAAERCPACGYVEAERLSEALPARTLVGGRYVVGRVLARANFALTYLAWDTLLAHRFVLKEYFPTDAAERTPGGVAVRAGEGKAAAWFEEGLARMLQEARLLVRLDHASLVDVLSYFKENSTAYLVTRFYDGVSLETHLAQRSGNISEAEALHLARSVLDVLGTMHEQGILHRDVKPANILLLPDGRPILLDLGAAVRLSDPRPAERPVILTPPYAPYEQYFAEGTLGPWTDLYALGATLYRMVTGQLPPPAIDRMQADTLQPPAALAPVSARFNEAVLRVLALRPEERPQTAQEFLSMLPTPDMDRAMAVGVPLPPAPSFPAPDHTPTEIPPPPVGYAPPLAADETPTLENRAPAPMPDAGRGDWGTSRESDTPSRPARYTVERRSRIEYWTPMDLDHVHPLRVALLLNQEMEDLMEGARVRWGRLHAEVTEPEPILTITPHSPYFQVSPVSRQLRLRRQRNAYALFKVRPLKMPEQNDGRCELSVEFAYEGEVVKCTELDVQVQQKFSLGRWEVPHSYWRPLSFAGSGIVALDTALSISLGLSSPQLSLLGFVLALVVGGLLLSLGLFLWRRAGRKRRVALG